MKHLFKTIFKIIMLTILLAIITPILYFAWRMGQPLSQPEFKGLTYYQFIEWRKMACQPVHPQVICETDLPKRDVANVTMPLILIFMEGGDPFQSITVSNFLPAIWDMIEYLFWFRNFKTPLLKGFGDVPTPAEFEAFKLAHAANTTAKP